MLEPMFLYTEAAFVMGHIDNMLCRRHSGFSDIDSLLWITCGLF